MQNPSNRFKARLREATPQIGLWSGLANSYSVELLACAGFDWLLLDGEHAPNDVHSVLAQLQALAPYSAQPVVRPVQDDPALIKQYLDIGAQTLLVPMIETAEQAVRLVAATRYPPQGTRGVGSALARASRWNKVGSYLQEADSQICVLVQVESANAMKHLREIAAVDGVDGVFFGPADLAASMGLLGRPADRRVKECILAGIDCVKQAGKAAGTLASDPLLARQYLHAGAHFVAVGVDTTLLLRAASELADQFKSQLSTLAEAPQSATSDAADANRASDTARNGRR